MLLDDGFLDATVDGTWIADRRLSTTVRCRPTIPALLAARLDRLASDGAGAARSARRSTAQSSSGTRSRRSPSEGDPIVRALLVRKDLLVPSPSDTRPATRPPVPPHPDPGRGLRGHAEGPSGHHCTSVRRLVSRGRRAIACRSSTRSLGYHLEQASRARGRARHRGRGAGRTRVVPPRARGQPGPDPRRHAAAANLLFRAARLRPAGRRARRVLLRVYRVGDRDARPATTCQAAATEMAMADVRGAGADPALLAGPARRTILVGHGHGPDRPRSTHGGRSSRRRRRRRFGRPRAARRSSGPGGGVEPDARLDPTAAAPTTSAGLEAADGDPVHARAGER